MAAIPTAGQREPATHSVNGVLAVLPSICELSDALAAARPHSALSLLVGGGSSPEF